MSATVAAALKKIAVYILTDKKALKVVGGIILVFKPESTCGSNCRYYVTSVDKSLVELLTVDVLGGIGSIRLFARKTGSGYIN